MTRFALSPRRFAPVKVLPMPGKILVKSLLMRHASERLGCDLDYANIKRQVESLYASYPFFLIIIIFLAEGNF